MIAAYIAEFMGTAMLILLGDGVVANVLLKDTKGHQSGWIVISFGWSMAVFVGVYMTARYSGAHLNPAVTLGLALTGKFPWKEVPGYILAQFCGAFLGALLTYLTYWNHYAQTRDPQTLRATFCTIPALKGRGYNLLTETIATFVLVIGVLYLASPKYGLGALDALPVGLLVLAIGLSLGGPTGYAINPARDLGPRLFHYLMPIPGKGPSDWSYAWVPLLGPLLGASLAAGVYLALH